MRAGTLSGRQECGQGPLDSGGQECGQGHLDSGGQGHLYSGGQECEQGHLDSGGGTLRAETLRQRWAGVRAGTLRQWRRDSAGRDS